jgi:hypothetical protein
VDRERCGLERAEVRLHFREPSAGGRGTAEERDLEEGMPREQPEQLAPGEAGGTQHRGPHLLDHRA